MANIANQAPRLNAKQGVRMLIWITCSQCRHQHIIARPREASGTCLCARACVPELCCVFQFLFLNKQQQPPDTIL